MNHFFKLQFCVGFCLACVVGIAGCGSESEPDATVQGTVTIDGELASSGTVAFHSSNDTAVAYGMIYEDGTFALRIGQGNRRDPDHSKIHSGEYVASVTVRGPTTPNEEPDIGLPPQPGKRLSAAEYGNQETSGLAFIVKPGLNVINIEVESATEEETVEEESTAPEPDTPETNTEETVEQPEDTEESVPETTTPEDGSLPEEAVGQSTEEPSP